MNQEKIGALIASLRKKQGLTQSQLGAKVGVGDRAVSKWERGITCPDISIINELSSILGITSDELLKGELNKEHKEQLKEHKFNKKLLLLIPLIIIVIITTIIIINKNKTYVYTLYSDSNEYDVVGEIIIGNNDTIININRINFRNKKLNQTFIKNYEYNLLSDDYLILRNGYIDDTEFISEIMTINNFINSLKINYKINESIFKNNYLKNGLVLKFRFLKEDGDIINKIIYIKVLKKSNST